MLEGGLTVEALEEAPAAVLVVDLANRQVVHVNDIAEELAPGTGLPVDLDRWSDAAALRDPDGAELSETTHPLSRVARAESVAGQAVSAARRSAMGDQRKPLWVVAMPMVGAPMLDGHALVVLLPLHDQRAEALGAKADAKDPAPAPDRALAELPDVEGELPDGQALRDRAISATALSFTVADALDPEQPLVWVNPAFTATTGFELDEVVGRNCRFLQGDDTDQPGRRRLREAIDQGVSVSVTLRNYRKDGSSFWNQVDLSPVRDPEGRIAHYVGIQTDVTDRVEAELRTNRALESEREARADAESARSRLAFLIEAVNRLSATLDADECAERLLSLVVPYLADWALLFRVADRDERGGAAMLGRHRNPLRQAEVDELLSELPRALHEGDLTDLLLDGREVRVIDHLDDPDSLKERAGYLRDLSITERTQALGGRQAMVVALTGRSAVQDVLLLVRTGDRSPFGEDDVTTALDLGRRAGLILENVDLYRAQARIADVLQRSLLPELPAVEGIDMAARYLANESGAEIGGDFYEVLDLKDAGLGLAVGDVTGHDILSAAAMGHLKGLLRAAGYDNHDNPAEVLEHVDHLMLGLGMPTIATAVFGHALRTDEGWRLRWSSAGHPPLVVRHPDGRTELATTARNDILLGLSDTTRTQHEIALAPGSTIVAYTDGLVERRQETMDEGLDRLIATVAAAPAGADQLADAVLEQLGGTAREDDIALLVVTLT